MFGAFYINNLLDIGDDVISENTKPRITKRIIIDLFLYNLYRAKY